MRRRPSRRLAVTAIVALLLGGATPALAAATPDPSATVSTSDPELTLVPAGNGTLQPGTDLAVSVALANNSGGATAESSVALAIGDQPLADRAALTAWIAGARDGVALREVGTTTLAATATGASTSGQVTVSAADPELAARPAGVYPIVATATVNGLPLVSTSTVVIPGPASGTRVGIVVPITAPPTTRGLLTSDELLALTAADGALTAQLDAVAGTPAILAIDPAIPAAIRVLGDATPGPARAWLDRLLALPNSRFALQFGDADLATQIQAGLAQPLEPTSLVSYLPAGTVSPTGGATATPDAGSTPLVPDLATLTDIGGARSGVYWPVGGTAGTAVVAALGALGTPDTPTLTMVPSVTTTAGAGGSRVGARVDSPWAALLAYDSAISDLLRSAADDPDTAGRNASLAAVTAHLALTDASAPVLVTVDRGEDRTRAGLRAAIEAAAGAPGTVPATLGDVLLAPVSGSVEVTDIPADPARVADLSGLLVDAPALDRFATILDDPALLTGRERAEVLQLMGAGWQADAAAGQAAVAAHRAATVTTLDSVGILASDVNLLSYGADYRPYVRNDLPWPVTVTLVARPDDARLIMQTRTDAPDLPADTNTRVVIPVEAQIANGQVNVDMHLVSPTGEPIGAPLNIAVEVHADWENIGLGILGGLLAIFLGVGILRTVLRRRAAKRAEPDAGVPAEDTE
jgi:hypothetical protein